MTPPVIDAEPAKPTVATGAPVALPGQPAPSLGLFALYLVGLAIGFHTVLADLYALVRPSPLFSYIPLVPIVTLYLLHQRRAQLVVGRPAYGLALAFVALGAALLAAGSRLPTTVSSDQVALGMAALLAFLGAGVSICFGASMLRTGLCPWLMLLFAIPLPAGMKDALEKFLQYTSADVSYWLLVLTSVPIYREGLVFHMPHLSIAVAPECSGINSTWVLLMCSLIAGSLLLRSPWRRTVLAAVVIPLGILRNAVRIITISLLTIYVDPGIIDSPLHHEGGPIFFAFSLIFFLGILLWLWRSEQKKRAAP